MSYVIYSAAPSLPLFDANGDRSVVRLERVEPLTDAAGVSPVFDPMLSSWVGGYDGPTPVVNTFRLVGLPVGDYKLYVYSSGGSPGDTTVVYCSANGGSPQSATLTLGTATTWTLLENYTVFDLDSIPDMGYLTLRVDGYLSGLQLLRV